MLVDWLTVLRAQGQPVPTLSALSNSDRSLCGWYWYHPPHSTYKETEARKG